MSPLPLRLLEKATGRSVWLEVLGFWRRASAERHLERLRRHIREPFLLAVSDQLHVDDADLEGLPAGIHRFRQMPLPDEIDWTLFRNINFDALAKNGRAKRREKLKEAKKKGR